MKPHIKRVEHKFIQFDFNTTPFAEVEAVLNEYIKNGWWLTNSLFIDEGKGFVGLLEYVESVEEDDSDFKAPWEKNR